MKSLAGVRAVTVILCGLLVAGCTSGSSSSDEQQAADSSASAAPTATTATPATTSTPTTTSAPSSVPTPTTSPVAALPPVTDPLSLPAMMRKKFDGRGLTLGRVLAREDAYTRYAVTYLSGKYRISGILNLPRGAGPFPVLVLAHGHIDLDIYTTGRGLMREQDFLARRGFVVLHTDYRNHAQSSDAPDAERDLTLGYTEDVINAVYAVRASTLPALDGRRVGLLGRSEGGGVALNTLVVAPGLVDAAVLYSSVSSTNYQNFQRWVAGSSNGDRILADHGTPTTHPDFWRGVSPTTYVDRVTEPVLIHHGTVDDTCPIQWSRDTVKALQDQGKDVQMYTYPGQNHAFDRSWNASMERTVAFFRANLRA